jgi:hypothetical protein
MTKNKTARIAAFVGGLGVSAALIGAAATTTGAYFTDSETGSIAGTTGHLSVDKNTDYGLNFNNLVPGEYKTLPVGYHTAGDTNEDIWLKFPAGTPYGQFTGTKGPGTSDPGVDGFHDGGMGRFGHFAVANSGGTVFSSCNLQNQPDGTSGCADGDGHGSNRPANSETDTDMGYCGVPHFIKLESDVPSGSDKQFTVTFGVTVAKPSRASTPRRPTCPSRWSPPSTASVRTRTTSDR